MGNVVELLPNNALCMDQQAIAERLHQLADQIGAGEAGGDVTRVCVVIQGNDLFDCLCFGRPTENMTLVGMLEWAKARFIGPIQ